MGLKHQHCSLSKKSGFDYPVVRRELRSWGYSYFLLNGEPRSYLEFPNHLVVVEHGISAGIIVVFSHVPVEDG